MKRSLLLATALAVGLLVRSAHAQTPPPPLGILRPVWFSTNPLEPGFGVSAICDPQTGATIYFATALPPYTSDGSGPWLDYVIGLVPGRPGCQSKNFAQ